MKYNKSHYSSNKIKENKKLEKQFRKEYKKDFLDNFKIKRDYIRSSVTDVIVVLLLILLTNLVTILTIDACPIPIKFIVGALVALTIFGLYKAQEGIRNSISGAFDITYHLVTKLGFCYILNEFLLLTMMNKRHMKFLILFSLLYLVITIVYNNRKERKTNDKRICK